MGGTFIGEGCLNERGRLLEIIRYWNTEKESKESRYQKNLDSSNQNSKSYIDSIKHGKPKENQQKIAEAHLTKQYKSRLGLTKVPKYIGYICCKY